MNILSLRLLSLPSKKWSALFPWPCEGLSDVSHGQHLLLRQQLNKSQRVALTIILSLFNQMEYPCVSKIVTYSEVLVSPILQIYKQAMPCHFNCKLKLEQFWSISANPSIETALDLALESCQQCWPPACGWHGRWIDSIVDPLTMTLLLSDCWTDQNSPYLLYNRPVDAHWHCLSETHRLLPITLAYTWSTDGVLGLPRVSCFCQLYLL